MLEVIKHKFIKTFADTMSVELRIIDHCYLELLLETWAYISDSISCGVMLFLLCTHGPVKMLNIQDQKPMLKKDWLSKE